MYRPRNISLLGGSSGLAHFASGTFKRRQQLCCTTRRLSRKQRAGGATESSYCDSAPLPGKRYCVYLIVFSWFYVASDVPPSLRGKRSRSRYIGENETQCSRCRPPLSKPVFPKVKKTREKMPVRDSIAALSSSSRLSKCGSRSGALGG